MIKYRTKFVENISNVDTESRSISDEGVVNGDHGIDDHNPLYRNQHKLA